MTTPYHQRNQDATVWVGNLDTQTSEELIFELFVQVGPLSTLAALLLRAPDLMRCCCAGNVNMPRDKVTNTHQGYAFVEFESPEDADYAIKCALVALAGACAHPAYSSSRIMNMVKLYGKPMRVNMVRVAPLCSRSQIQLVRVVCVQASKDRKQEEFFANLFIGNLDREVDEKLLHDTFSRFGAVISCKVSPVRQSLGFVAHRMFVPVRS